MARKQHHVKTAKEAVELLGGTKHVAHELHIGTYVVERWISQNMLGRAFYLHFFLSLWMAGLDPTPELFGVDDWKDVAITRRAGGTAPKRRKIVKPK